MVRDHDISAPNPSLKDRSTFELSVGMALAFIFLGQEQKTIERPYLKNLDSNLSFWRILRAVLELSTFFLIAVFGFLSEAEPLATNQIPVLVNGSNTKLYGRTYNVATVSVTLCEPGTNNCQTIDKIQLDTGSVGLRVYSNILDINLPEIKTVDDQTVSECLIFASYDSYFGRIRNADVRLGGQQASNLRIQTIDTGGPTRSHCNSSFDRSRSPSDSNINGTLGVAPAADECIEQGCGRSNGQILSGVIRFKCDQSNCTELSNASDFSVQNPFFHFAKNNNGYLLAFPPVDSHGQSDTSGILTLGLNTRKNNKIDISKTELIPIDSRGYLHVQYKQKTYPAVLDTGTTYYLLPDDLDIPRCGKDNTDVCPRSLFDLDGHFQNKRRVPFSIQLQRWDLSTIDATRYVLPYVGAIGGTDGGKEAVFWFGMPYFFGRKIFFGFPGALKAGDQKAFVGL